MPHDKVHELRRPTKAETADIIRRASVAYLQSDGPRCAMPDLDQSAIRALQGRFHVVLRGADGVALAVYRVRNDNGLLRRMKRPPPMVLR